MGKALPICSGYGNKVDETVSSYPGHGVGSIDLEICLLPATICVLEYEEFIRMLRVFQLDELD